MEDQMVYTLDTKSKASEISLDMLRQSQLIRMPLGNKNTTRPVQSWEMMDHVVDVLKDRNTPFDIDKIWVQNNETQQILTNEERGRFSVTGTPVNRWLFNQLITKIKIGNPIDPEYDTSLAISFNKQGIALAFGENVRICQNMSIFGNNIMTTYGGNKMPYEKMLEVLSRWMETLPAKQQFNKRVIDSMKSIEIGSQNKINEVIGKLYRNAVSQAYGKNFAPFTISQMSTFVREVENSLTEDSRLGTVWDLYNFGTNLFKPADVDMTNMFQITKHWHDFLTEEFLDIRDAVLIAENELEAVGVSVESDDQAFV
jgi:hypothetical protein